MPCGAILWGTLAWNICSVLLGEWLQGPSQGMSYLLLKSSTSWPRLPPNSSHWRAYVRACSPVNLINRKSRMVRPALWFLIVSGNQGQGSTIFKTQPHSELMANMMLVHFHMPAVLMGMSAGLIASPSLRISCFLSLTKVSLSPVCRSNN